MTHLVDCRQIVNCIYQYCCYVGAQFFFMTGHADYIIHWGGDKNTYYFNWIELIQNHSFVTTFVRVRVALLEAVLSTLILKKKIIGILWGLLNLRCARKRGVSQKDMHGGPEKTCMGRGILTFKRLSIGEKIWEGATNEYVEEGSAKLSILHPLRISNGIIWWCFDWHSVSLALLCRVSRQQSVSTLSWTAVHVCTSL